MRSRRENGGGGAEAFITVRGAKTMVLARFYIIPAETLYIIFSTLLYSPGTCEYTRETLHHPRLRR